MNTIIVILYDAGGAELLSSLVLNERASAHWKIAAPCDSPAYAILEKKNLLDLVTNDDINTLLNVPCPDRHTYIFYSPGWNMDVTKSMRLAGENGYIRFSFLDHWIDYRERFGYPDADWQQSLPEHIVVSDSVAYKIASEYKFSGLLKLRNYHSLSQQEKCQELRARDYAPCDTLLFISQTVHSPGENKNFTYHGEDERKVLENIVLHLDFISECHNIKRINIRLHPSEKSYPNMDILQSVDNMEVSIEHSANRELLESISEASLVIGLNSMALFTAYTCGKPVVSIMPSDSAGTTLPLPDALCLHDSKDICSISENQFCYNPDIIDFYPDILLENLFDHIDTGVQA